MNSAFVDGDESVVTPQLASGDWSADLGTDWRLIVLLASICFGLAGWFSPLADADLPMHLRLGEWIWLHGAVPWQEPFAWTRAGAPYYAYSWLAEGSYYGLLRGFGESGLHFLQAVVAVGGFATIVWLGRVARWQAWPTLLLAVLHGGLWCSFVVAVRPQAFMAITVPMAWIGAEYLARGATRRGVAYTLLAAFLTTNTHLLFPVTLVPIVRLLADASPRWRSVALFAGANAVGWALNPYLFVLPELMRINLTSNAMSGPFSSVTELEAGWRVVMRDEFTLRGLVLLLVGAGVMLPSHSLTNRERFWYALAWASGLALFGAAVRALTIWIIVSLPLLARLFALIPAPSSLMVRRMTATTLVFASFIFVLVRLRDGADVPRARVSLESRQLPSTAAVVLEPLAAWMDCAVLQPAPRADARPRVFTVFNYGSHLLWRVPAYSYSIDSRGIFPDSVARPEIFQLAGGGPLKLGPWRSSDLAIVPLKHAAAQLLDASAEWRRVRVSIPTDTTASPAGLWVRSSLLSANNTPSVSPDTLRPTSAIPARAPCRASTPVAANRWSRP